MMNNPYWNFATVPMNPFIAAPVVPQQVIPQPVQQPPQQPQPQPIQQVASQQNPVTPAIPTVWNWKVTDSYQHMLMESVPFDGTPVLFMLKNESVFYIVSMIDGKKMVNGYSFVPLDNVPAESSAQQLTPEEQTEQRLTKIESGMATLMEQINKLVEVQQNHEPNIEPTEKAITRQPIS